MAEKGIAPKVPRLQQAAFRAVRAFTTPLQIDDYIEMINPLWSTRELRGRIEEIRRETPDAATIVIRPGYDWMGHEPGQYLRIGIDANGRRHWRAYSLTSDPDRADGCISITVKHVDEGVVSPRLVKQGKPGDIVSLGGVEGDFKLPDPLPEQAPVRERRQRHHPDHEHAAQPRPPQQARRRRADPLRAHPRRGDLRRRAARAGRAIAGFHLHEQHTGSAGRIDPKALEDLCPDWREREAFISGPGEMLDTMTEHWESEGVRDRLHMERFQPIIG